MEIRSTVSTVYVGESIGQVHGILIESVGILIHWYFEHWYTVSHIAPSCLSGAGVWNRELIISGP